MSVAQNIIFSTDYLCVGARGVVAATGFSVVKPLVSEDPLALSSLIKVTSDCDTFVASCKYEQLGW